MSIEALTWCKRQECPTPTSKLVLFVLSNYADEQHSCYPSESHIGKICGISGRQVRTHLKKLESLGIIRILMRKGTSNRYVLGVEADFRGRVEADFRGGRKLTSAYTKEIQKRKRRTMNDLAG